MIIWRGKGGVIALIAFGSFLLAEWFTRAAFHDDTYYQNHGWPKLLALWTAAAVVYALGSWFGVKQERTLIDKSTGQEIKVSREGELFFIPARYWPMILVVLGGLFFVRG